MQTFKLRVAVLALLVAMLLLFLLTLLGNFHFEENQKTTLKHHSTEELLLNRFSNRLKSSHRCVGDLSPKEKNLGCSCVFTDICYHKATSTFEYYSPKLISGIPQPKAIIKTLQETTLNVTSKSPSNYTMLEGTYILRHGPHEFTNIGHRIWDVLFGFFLNLKMLGLNEIEKVHPLLRYRNSAVRKTGILSDLIFNPPLQSFEELVEKNGNDTICFEKLVLASGTHPSMFSFRTADGNIRKPANYLKSSMFYEFRGIILRHFGIDPEFTPDQPQIVIFHKTKSDGKKVPTRSVVNFDQVVDHIRQKHPHVPLKVVDPSELSLKEQMDVFSQTTLLISPPGGISTVIPFLPRNSHVILFDYFAFKAHRRYRINASVSMEADVWDSIAHLKIHYYQVFHRKDHIWVDDHQKSVMDSRRGTSLIVDVNRLEVLVRRALNAPAHMV